jgi:hypothetical protein
MKHAIPSNDPFLEIICNLALQFGQIYCHVLVITMLRNGSTLPRVGATRKKKN